MSIAAWPSIDPANPRSACRRAASMSRERTKRRNSTASTTIISGPPTNSAAVNCQPISRARMMPNSTTRLVEPISKAMAAVKFAPLRNNDRARATAAYEHDEDAAPRPAATADVRGRSSPSSATIVERRTTACTTADRAKPRIRAHRISQVIDPDRANARSTACVTSCAMAPPTEYPPGVFQIVTYGDQTAFCAGPTLPRQRENRHNYVKCAGNWVSLAPQKPTHRAWQRSHRRNTRHTGNNNDAG